MVEEACEEATARGDTPAYVVANQSFHEAIYTGSRNEWAAAQIRFLRLRCAGYQQARFDLPGRRAQSLVEHRQVMDNILAGKAEEARLAMIDHIALGGRDLADFVSSLHPSLIEG
ncbi:TPA: FCD domain-containing protein [Pseudomonas aeruginosa]|nr:FCD domain-containing protein [Pseudomonas aeruginosa]HBO4702811.1 FCD domain-containing protein [Pseudomonas aeruginosa]